MTLHAQLERLQMDQFARDAAPRPFERHAGNYLEERQASMKCLVVYK